MGELDELLKADLGPGVWVCIGLYLTFLLVIGFVSAYKRRKSKIHGEIFDAFDDHYNASQSSGMLQ
eukprot:TRINITY_DN15164_c0_g1_i1.p1 TRINITY_DN15164_c0_g1~~TRINITY_DN15164_c0_g1_i1.p1  ORF type:complete len:66 (-),score=5.35 TRINITY_DN15164_c0_g1_i1:179-376(-)